METQDRSQWWVSRLVGPACTIISSLPSLGDYSTGIYGKIWLFKHFSLLVNLKIFMWATILQRGVLNTTAFTFSIKKNSRMFLMLVICKKKKQHRGSHCTSTVLYVMYMHDLSPNFKLFKSPRIDSKELILPGGVAWRASTTTLLLFLFGS